MAQNNQSKVGSFIAELFRFLVIGVYATLIDYVVEVWMGSLLAGWIASNPGNHFFAYLTTFVLGLIGFLFGTPATWSLNAVWVFRNVEDEKKGRSLKGALLFTIFAFAGLVLASIVHFLGYMICLEWTDLNINILPVCDQITYCPFLIICSYSIAKHSTAFCNPHLIETFVNIVDNRIVCNMRTVVALIYCNFLAERDSVRHAMQIQSA